MTKVKNRASSNSFVLKGKLLQLCLEHSVRVTKLLPISDLCFCATADDAAILFSKEVHSMLVAIDCKPTMFKELKAMRSIMLRRLDDRIVSHSVRRSGV